MVCEECGGAFMAKRSDAKCCSKACSRRAYYRANRARESETFRAWRAAHLEQERARWAAYGEANRARLAQARRAAYAADPEAGRLAAAEWRRRNPGGSDAWRKRNPELWAMRNRESQRRRRGEAPVDYAAILERDGMTCHLCLDEIDGLADLHFDHVIPLSKGGPHVAENIRPAHARCNLRKGARLIA